MTITAGEQQTHDYYMNIGPAFADPLARQTYAESASIEEQHVTQYESLLDPTQSLIEQWLLHEATEVYLYLRSSSRASFPILSLTAAIGSSCARSSDGSSA